jgi:hypothetical protein
VWNVTSFVIPVTIGTTGIVIKGVKLSVDNTRKAFNKFCKKTAVLGTSQIIRKVLQHET